ncbi:DUF1294 domain-containing protein [Pseudoalteromonas shioyasakiensis]|uniref:DUF1294 domain-containing protein n=1 Tax=Pseudoalteromonas shioyasakiensis TaxID=1190813 RepID=UPI001C3D83DB|nr:DUF1294 domain-containing protein [Pseudoalteromonas shioyasakiensis]
MIKKTLITFSLLFLALLWLVSWQLNITFFIASTYSVASLISFLVYGWDKRLAMQHGENVIRVPERTLHILGLIGGWPGSLIAQQWLRHKSKKRSFIAVLWLTIIVNGSVLSSLYYLQLI